MSSAYVGVLALTIAALASLASSSAPSCQESVENGFSHPGIYHSCASLNRMQANIQSNTEPFITALDLVVDKTDYLQENGGWMMEGPAARLEFGGSDGNNLKLQLDGKASYVLTLGWYATGNGTWLNRATTIIRSWAGTMVYMNEQIQGGEGFAYMTAAAEILRGTGAASGWTSNDTSAYIAMIDNVIETTPWNEASGPTSDSFFMNQGAYGNSAGMAAAVFAERFTLYSDMVRHIAVGANPDPSIDYAIPLQISGETNYYGQVTEMGRDQAHPMGTLRAVSYMGLTAEIQGSVGGSLPASPNFFKQNSSRLLAGFEYYSRYNLNQSVAWEPKPIRPKTSTEVYSTVNAGNRGTNFTNGASPVEAIGVGWYEFNRQGFSAQTDFGNYTEYLKTMGKGWDVFEFGDAATVQYLGI